MPDPKTSPHDSVCQTRGHDCDEVDALRAKVAELEKSLKQAIEWPGEAGWKIRNEWRKALNP